MRGFAIAVVVAFAVALGGCQTVQMQMDEQKVGAVVGAIQSGAPVAGSTARSTVDLICGWALPISQGVQAAIAQHPVQSQRMRNAVNKAYAGLAALSSVCSGGAPTNTLSWLVRAWSAWSAAKAAYAEVQAASASP
jgi:hypothetical protein